MKALFLTITNYGIKPDSSAEVKEQTKLVNGISFLGVPICLTFVLIFGITGHVYLTLTFLAGILIFTLPLFLNKWLGLATGRFFVCVMAPVLFGTASVVSGKDTGFFLGFLVISVPPMIVYPKIKPAVYFIAFCILCLGLSIMGNIFITPLENVPFAMGVFLFNLFTVLITTIGIVFLFKIELNESREKLFEKNKEITDSINYAKKIQSAYMPGESVFHSLFEDAFLYFNPKDIVSGDFYWLYQMQKENSKHFNRFCAVADCTGHGVPGALMSVICCNALNEAVVNNKLNDTAAILQETRRIVKQNLKSTYNSGQKDGMDIALIQLDTETGDLFYSGANNPAWVIQNNQICELKPDKQPIGVHANEKDFSTQQMHLNKGDTIYLFSDGYADQFGGPKGKKYKYKQLHELLLSNAHLPMQNQLHHLEKSFQNWKGQLEQTDDVCVIGIRF